MIVGFWCPKCKKTFKKGPTTRKNVTFAPVFMTHTHKGIKYVCYAVEIFKVIDSKCEVGGD